MEEQEQLGRLMNCSWGWWRLPAGYYGWAVLGLLFCVCSCEQGKIDQPVLRVIDTRAEPSVRLSAARQMCDQAPDDPALLDAMRAVICEPGHPNDLRRVAADHLMRVDEKGFRRFIRERINQVTSRELLDYLFELAVDRKWMEFTFAAIRSYAQQERGVADDQRAERRVIEALNPGGTVEAVAWGVFADGGGDATLVERVAAWQLLNRLSSRKSVTERLESMTNRSIPAAEIYSGFNELGVLPVNAEGVLWLIYLHDPLRREWWEAVKARVRLLSMEQREGLELRHLPVLLCLDERVIRMSRAELMNELVRWVVNCRSGKDQERSKWSAAMDRREVRDALNQCCWGDMAAIYTIHQALESGALTEELFRQADADQMDKGTEYGGVIICKDRDGQEGGKRFEPRLFAPLVRSHDRKYLPSPVMIESMYEGLAHYHFHAQEYKNEEFNRPGEGDLRLAETLRPNGVVFTFIDHDHLNADFYQPNGLVVDLGVIGR